MVNPALHGAAMNKEKVSAKGKYTASSVLSGQPTKTDKAVGAIQQKKTVDLFSSQKNNSSPEQKVSQSRPSSPEPAGPSDQQVQKQQEEKARRLEEVHQASVEREKLNKPGGWRNVVDVLKIAINPFSKEKIVADTGRKGVDAALGVVANNPYSVALGITGVAGLVKSATTGIAAVTSKTAVAQAGKIGTTGFTFGGTTSELGAVKGVAQTMATNTATKKATASMLTKVVGAVKDPAFVVGALMATIGSYPFAGFIKEEALQTVGFGVKTALDNGDMEGADAAIELQESILDPGMWDEIKSKIPFVNVLASLDDFYSSARLKLDIDKKVVSTLKVQAESGETDAEMYARIAQERLDLKEQERVADAAYYAGIEERRKAAKEAERKADEEYYEGLSDAAAAAEKKKREEDAAYWDKILNDRPKEEGNKTRLDDDYWNEYYKTLAKVKANSAPSNLKFGLL